MRHRPLAVMLLCAAVARPAPGGGHVPPPLPVLAPSGLCGDAGDGRAYLRWNPQIEDERVVGWRVRAEPAAAAPPDTFREPACVVRGLANGTPCTFRVVGVLADGSLTPPGNAVTVVPRATGTATLATCGGERLAFGPHGEIPLGETAVRIRFPDGQELVYDRYGPVDWRTAAGAHLVFPKAFGNPLDIGRLDDRGLPVAMPAEGPPAADGPPRAAAAAPRHAQSGTPHPVITDPLTLPVSRQSNDAARRWLEPAIDGDRVTLHYTLPIELAGFHSWTNVEVWETWWPIARDRRGCAYRGLARLVEVSVPDMLDSGYQVMLNNGFGPDGTRRGVVSYGTGFREPAHEIVDFSADTDRRVFFQGRRPIRQGYGYHPDGNCLQSSPLIFYDWGTGSLTITARSLYYHAGQASSSYVEEGADGVWPNLAWDLAAAGRRTAVDTVEYLHAADLAQPLPQRFVNARFEAYGDVSRRMGVQRELGAVAIDTPHSQIRPTGGPEKFAAVWIAKLANTGVDTLGMYHDLWHANPHICAPAWRLDEGFAANPEIKRMNAAFRAAGIHPGFWFRPEFAKTSLPTAFASNVLPLEQYYHGCEWMHYPTGAEALAGGSIPTLRDHPEWIRRTRSGGWPAHTPYQWIPMSLAMPWWDEVMWPTLRTSAALGFERLLIDGGFGGLQGVDHAPRLAGRTRGAVPCQPYWWRMFRTMEHLGLRMFGECTAGWKGCNTAAGGAGDEHCLWMFQMGWIVDGPLMSDPRNVHRALQLYNTVRGDPRPELDAVRRYGLEFHRRHPAPDWIELVNLRQQEPVTVSLTRGSSVGGVALEPTPERPHAYAIRPWTWDDCIWHYDDGRRVVYPAFDAIDWKRPEPGR